MSVDASNASVRRKSMSADILEDLLCTRTDEICPSRRIDGSARRTMFLQVEGGLIR